MKKKILISLCLTLLIPATACSSTPEPNEVPIAPSTSTVVVSATTTKATSKTGAETETETMTVTHPPIQVPTTTAASNVCKETYGHWNTMGDSTDSLMVRGDVYMVRTGQHECFDRIVIDVDTRREVGYHARYVDVVEHTGSGFRVPVAGEAALELVVDAPFALSLHDDMPEDFTTTPDWKTLREVKFAGSFEGLTKLAIGVDSKVKFGVFHHTDTNGETHVVVDLVHPF